MLVKVIYCPVLPVITSASTVVSLVHFYCIDTSLKMYMLGFFILVTFNFYNLNVIIVINYFPKVMPQ